MWYRCIECNEQPRLGDLGSSYAETFVVRGPEGGLVSVTLHLCVRCGAHFVDRLQLREYLRAKLPALALERPRASAHLHPG